MTNQQNISASNEDLDQHGLLYAQRRHQTDGADSMNDLSLHRSQRVVSSSLSNRGLCTCMLFVHSTSSLEPEPFRHMIILSV